MHIKLRELLDMVVAELKSCNQQIEYYKGYPEDYETNLPKRELNIPFLIAPLTQSFEANENNTYNDLIDKLEKYSSSVSFDNTRKFDCCVPCNLTVSFYTDSEDYCSDCDYASFWYTISFYVDERGYCGYGCDWSAPRVLITKNITVNDHSWHGDTHDYRKFEDEYYSKDRASAEEEKKKEKELKIEQLRKEIEESEELLRKLLVS